MPRAIQISDSEWDVMECVWDAGDCTASDVIKKLRATHDWNHSTIRTLLARLVEKRALDYRVDGSRYIYRPAVSREKCVRQIGRSFLDKVFHGDVGARSWPISSSRDRSIQSKSTRCDSCSSERDQ